MTRKTIFEWAELFQNDIQEGASQSNIIQLLEDYKTEQLILHPVSERDRLMSDMAKLIDRSYKHGREDCSGIAC